MRNLFISFIHLILLHNFIIFPAYAQSQNAPLVGTGGQQPSAQPRQGVEIGGTGSPNFYHYWDSQTQSEVWGVHTPPQPEQQTPPPPIFVTPEIKWPYPQESKTINQQNTPVAQ